MERQESLSSDSHSEPAKKIIKPKYGKYYISVYSQKRQTTSNKLASCKQEKGIIVSTGNTVENHDSKQLPLLNQSPDNNLKQKSQKGLDMSIKKKEKVAGKSADKHIVEKHVTKQLTQPRQLPTLKKTQANNLDVLRYSIIPELEQQEFLSTTSGSESNKHAKKKIKPKYGKGYVSPYE